jgi:hypothetical protein
VLISGVPHIVGKLSTRVTTFLLSSLQSKVCTRNYDLPKCWNSQFLEFQDSQLWGQKHLDVAPMANHKKYYEGEGSGFPQIRVVLSLVSSCMPMWRAPKFLVDPLEGPSMWQCGRSWNLEPLPSSQHLEG